MQTDASCWRVVGWTTALALFFDGSCAAACSESTAAALARRIGCGPSSLAVAGFSPSQVEGIFARLQASEGAVANLASAETAVSSLAAQLSGLQAQWDVDCLDETADAIATVEASSAAARQTLAQCRTALVDIAMQDASTGARDRLESSWRYSGGRCPLAVIACSTPDEQPLLDAIFSKQERNLSGEMSSAVTSALEERLTRSDVASAQHDLDANEAPITLVFANWSP